MTNLLSVFSSELLFLESFCGCFGTFSDTERQSLVKLESVVKVLPALVQPFSLFFVLKVCLLSGMRLTHDG